MSPEAPLLFRINAYRSYAGFLVLLFLAYYYGPTQDIGTFMRYHDFNPVRAYAALPSPITQVTLPMILIFLLYLRFEDAIRYYITLFTWSEVASDEIVARNKAFREKRLAELSSSCVSSSTKQ